MKRKTTKRALLLGLASMFLCFTMLLGTTYAWFTDSVESGVNQIIAGNLDVELEYAKTPEGTYKDITNASDVFVAPEDEEKGLWEPGHTEVAYLKVTNNGDLALKYSLQVNPSNEVIGKNADGEDIKLSEILKFSATEPSATAPAAYTRGTAQESASASSVKLTEYAKAEQLAAGESHYVALVVYMPKEVGNEANYRNSDKPSIEFAITLFATQVESESDSFGNDYDSEAFIPAPIVSTQVTGSVTTDAENKVANDVNFSNDKAGATIPAGVQLENGTTEVTLSVSNIETTGSNITLGANEVLTPIDVHVAGVSEDNDVPMEILIKEATTIGLNNGSLNLYHVEDGVTNTMTYVDTNTAFTAHNQFKYDPATGDVILYMATFSEVALVSDTINKWEGEFDYSWYDASKTELTIANADQLAAFGAIVGGMKKVTGRVDGKYTYSEEVIQDSFSGKTVKLIADINLGYVEGEEGYSIFYPIGYWNEDGTYEKSNKAISSGFYTFQGTFDGNGHTIANVYQNTWDMKGDNNYYPATEQRYRDGMGIFGKVYGGTVKNLTVKDFSSDGEYTTTGVIAAYADCGAKFENITIFNCNPRVYNIGNGGIVGCVGWYTKDVTTTPVTFKNITVDNSNKISALWGSWDVACGGIVGQYYPTSGQSAANYPVNAGINFENCHVAAEIDVYNDVCANYQYYAYRYAGMMIGSIRENETKDGHVYPKMDGITATDCTVHFDDWVNHYYCELVANSLASYTHDHQMSRLVRVKSVDAAKMQVVDLDGNSAAIPTSGRVNYVVVATDGKGNTTHGTENATCYHFVNGVQHFHDVADADNPNPTETVNGVAGVLKEDKQCVYLKFNQLFTGYGWGVTSKGLGSFNGIEIHVNNSEKQESVEKFVVNTNIKEVPNALTLGLGNLFSEKANNTEGTANTSGNIPIKLETLTVSVEPVGESTVTEVKFEPHNIHWEYSTLAITGEGTVKITIQDYYYCKPTSITVNIGTPEDSYQKFTAVPNEKVYTGIELRVGDLFTEAANCPVYTDANTLSLTFTKSNQPEAYVTFTQEVTDWKNADWKNGKIIFNEAGVITVTIKDEYRGSAQTFDVAVSDEQLSSAVDGIIVDNEYSFVSDVRRLDGTVYGDFDILKYDMSSDSMIEEDLNPNPTSVQFFLNEDDDYIYIGYREENPVSSDTTIYFDFNPRLDWNSRGQVMCYAYVKDGAMRIEVYEYFKDLVYAAELDDSRYDKTANYYVDGKVTCSYGVNTIEIKLKKDGFENYAFNGVTGETSIVKAYGGNEISFNTIGFRAFGQDPEIGFRETWAYGDKTKDEGTPYAFHIHGQYGYIEQNITLEKYNPAKIDGVIDENEYKWTSGEKLIKTGDDADVSENFTTLIKKELDAKTPSQATSVQFYMHEDSEYLYVAYKEISAINSTAVYLDFNPRIGSTALKDNTETEKDNRGQILLNVRVNDGVVSTKAFEYYSNNSDLNNARQVSTTEYLGANVSDNITVKCKETKTTDAEGTVTNTTYEIIVEMRISKSALADYAFNGVNANGTLVSANETDTMLTTIGFRAFGQHADSEMYETWAYGKNLVPSEDTPAFHILQNTYAYITQNIVLKKPIQN